MKKVRQLSHLSSRMLNKILDECEEIEVKKDQYLFREGQIADFLYLIIDGCFE